MDDLDERLGCMADKLDSALYAAMLPLPTEIHIEGLETVIREVRDQLADTVRERSGEDPWQTNPLSG